VAERALEGAAPAWWRRGWSSDGHRGGRRADLSWGGERGREGGDGRKEKEATRVSEGVSADTSFIELGIDLDHCFENERTADI
jgi:hypothetical protein